MWKYYFENIGDDDKPVAIYYNEKNIPILKVIETRNSHLSIPYVKFIESFSVLYYDEIKLSNESKTDSVDEILNKRLIAGCKLIEKNYKEQIKHIAATIL